MNKIYHIKNQRFRNKTYRRSESAIQKALLIGVRDRSICTSVNGLCLSAEVTRPTFYSHYRNPNEAMRGYEKEIINDFKNALPNKQLNRDVTFTILLSSITRNRNYFLATLGSGDSYILIKMLDYLKPRLVARNISEHTYILYRGQLKTIIQIWGTKDRFAKSRIPFYAKKLAQAKIIRWEDE